MIFNMFFPIIEFFLFYGIRLAKRFWDSGLTLRTTTKSKTIDAFVLLYSGPIYTIHYKYSYLLNITFITFTFGAGIPLLFPIALGSFVVLYIVERLAVAYSYQRPPMFDAELSKHALATLIMAPCLYMTVGWWMLDNI